ncbi:MAG TPA: hypothetical protein VI386_32825 [Candidatus Sulfotelmatobacter sp.]
MEQLKSSEHWTAESIANFTYRIAADFLAQVETKIEKGEVNRTELAKRLDRTPGRVSQLLNNPGNLTVNSAVRLVRAAGMKVALVAYEDSDPENNNGPVNSAIFYQCWKHAGAPTTFFDLTASTVTPVVNCFNSFSINGRSFMVGTAPIPINTNPLWMSHASFISGSMSGNGGTTEGQIQATVHEIRNAANIRTSIEPTGFMASTATN